MTNLRDFMTDSFIDDFAFNMIKIFEDAKGHKFNPKQIAEIRKFTNSLFDEFTFKPEEIAPGLNIDPVNHFNNLMKKFVDKVVGMINFLVMYKLEEMRLHSRIEELENQIKAG